MSLHSQFSSKARIWSVFFGNLFEHYDTAIFGFLSPFLAPLIFPNENPITALILTYGIIPLGMLARPVGALVFGYIGDLYGREKALFISLFAMAIVSFAVALTPTYATAGIAAPILFVFWRLLQNFFAAGEIMGGGIFLLENTPAKKQDLLSSFYNASTIAGILLASLGVGIFAQWEESWRILYLFGCVTALFGCIIRYKIPPTNQDQNPCYHSIFDWMKIGWTYKKTLFFIALASGFNYANYSMSLVAINGLVPFISSFTKAQMMYLNTALLILDLILLPLFGLLASKITREKLMMGASILTTLSAAILFSLFENASWGYLIGARVFFVLLGVAFAAPFHAWCQDLVLPQHRYAIISFGYAIGTQLIGAPTSSISLWLFQKTDSIVGASIYWIVLAFFVSGILVFSKRTEKAAA